MQLGVDIFFTQFKKSQLKPAFLVWQGGRDEIHLGGVIFEQPFKDLPFFDSPSFFVTLKWLFLLRPYTKYHKSDNLPLICVTLFLLWWSLIWNNQNLKNLQETVGRW